MNIIAASLETYNDELIKIVKEPWKFDYAIVGGYAREIIKQQNILKNYQLVHVENFDNDVKSTAKLGNRKLELKIADSKNSIIVTNDNGKLRNEFPRWFDFKESLRLLGYKVSERVKSSSQISVRW
jgi:hypothetical protein